MKITSAESPIFIKEDQKTPPQVESPVVANSFAVNSFEGAASGSEEKVARQQLRNSHSSQDMFTHQSILIQTSNTIKKESAISGISKNRISMPQVQKSEQTNKLQADKKNVKHVSSMVVQDVDIVDLIASGGEDDVDRLTNNTAQGSARPITAISKINNIDKSGLVCSPSGMTSTKEQQSLRTFD